MVPSVAFVFYMSLFVPHLTLYGASEGLCFLIVVFPGYLHLYLFNAIVKGYTYYPESIHFDTFHVTEVIYGAFKPRKRPVFVCVIGKYNPARPDLHRSSKNICVLMFYLVFKYLSNVFQSFSDNEIC